MNIWITCIIFGSEKTIKVITIVTLSDMSKAVSSWVKETDNSSLFWSRILAVKMLPCFLKVGKTEHHKQPQTCDSKEAN